MGLDTSLMPSGVSTAICSEVHSTEFLYYISTGIMYYTGPRRAVCAFPYIYEYTGIPDSKVYGDNIGPIWGWQDPGGPQVGPMNFAIWDIFQTLTMIKYKLLLLMLHDSHGWYVLQYTLRGLLLLVNVFLLSRYPKRNYEGQLHANQCHIHMGIIKVACGLQAHKRYTIAHPMGNS